MFFKNAYVFTFTKVFSHSLAELTESLQESAFTPLGSTELRHYGWVNSLGKGSGLAVEANGNILICARKEEKILPAFVMKDMVNERVEALESDQGRGATKKEREQFKEDVIFELLPRAFNRVTDTHGYINSDKNIIVINSSSRGNAEDFLALLRKSLGTLPVTTPLSERDPSEVMTDWINDNSSVGTFGLGVDFKVGSEAHFSSVGDQAASAIVKNEDLFGDEVKAHLDADQYVTKIALEYDDCMSFMLNDDLSIKRIKFFDVIQEQSDDIEDADEKLMSDFTVMSGELNRMINGLHLEFNFSAKDSLED